MKYSLTVIAPSYNHEEYIEECIASIANQSSNTYDLDLIIIDDSSTDDTAFIIRDILSKKDIKLAFRNIDFSVNNHNAGAHNNYNVALSKVKSDIVHFVNTDDIFSKNRFKHVIDAFSNCNELEKKYFWGFGRILLANTLSKIITGGGFWQYLMNIYDYSVKHYPSFSFFLLKDNLAISTGNIFVSKHLANEVHGFGNYRYVHDWDFILKCILFSEPVFIDANDSEYIYRLHSGNTFRKLGHIGGLESFEVLYRYFLNAFLRIPVNRKTLAAANYPKLLIDIFLKENPAIEQIANKVLTAHFTSPSDSLVCRPPVAIPT